MFYRMKQLYHTLFAKVEPSEYAWLEKKLAPAEFALFTKQPLPEQRHALDVAFEINNKKKEIIQTYGQNIYENLILAALLHDCGKSLIRLHLWQRVFIVIAGCLPQSWRNKIIEQRNLFGKTLLIYKRHPAWGKRLAARIGVNKEVQSLIQNHHSPTNPVEQILYQTDNRH
ncbi:MAG TPA: hypothetical protein GXX46_02560 [Peptococcaceae bacterium]|nr:hypothetical protein [Peptococcaceae bacterium]